MGRGFESMSISAAGPFEVLDVLWDQAQRGGRLVPKVEEEVSLRGLSLRRSVAVYLQVPTAQHSIVDSSIGLPFAYPLRVPRRNKVWAPYNLSVSSSAPCRVLGHHEHVSYSQSLIQLRFWSVCLDWVATDPAARAHKAIAVCNGLISIPTCDPSDADLVLRRHFDGHGHLKLLNGESDERSHSYEQRLFRLCSDLCDRYLLLLTFAAKRGDSVIVTYSFDDTLPVTEPGALITASDQARQLIGTAPRAARFHAPLARVTPSYELRFSAGRGTFVHDQRFLQKYWDSDLGIAKYFAILEGGVDEVHSWRQAPGTRTTRLHLSNGHNSRVPVYVGVQAFERPPGTIGRACLIAVGALISTLALTATRYLTNGAVQGDVAALGIALFSVISLGVDGLMGSSAPEPRSMVSRLSNIASSLALFWLAVWMLVPADAGVGDDGWQSVVVRSWVLYGWLVPVVVLSLLAGYMWMRMNALVRTFFEVVPRL